MDRYETSKKKNLRILCMVRYCHTAIGIYVIYSSVYCATNHPSHLHSAICIFDRLSPAYMEIRAPCVHYAHIA